MADNPDLDGGGNSARVAKDELESLLRRVENLEESKAEIAEDIKSVKAEAKAKGYDMKAFNAMLSLRKKDPSTRQMIGFYAETLGVFE
jgi:uncharacterized protein (UPF0335 family)